ncbi:MAG: hypothetical protein M3513_03595 [Actinomycetota bacterium]|nr:hypothetical protein [Actinomycetota bacterium]
MPAVVDSSTLISLAWSGYLRLLHGVPVEMVVPDVVRTEVVTQGAAAGYADAVAIDTAIAALAIVATRPGGGVDAAVLAAAGQAGTLVTNDQALGRRAANLGSRWLRTADLVILCVKTDAISAVDGRAALDALHATGRLSPALHTRYLEEL